MFGNDLAIYETIELSASVFPNTTNAPFALSDPAAMVAKIAAHPFFVHGFIKHGFFHIIPKGFLGDELSFFQRTVRLKTLLINHRTFIQGIVDPSPAKSLYHMEQVNHVIILLRHCQVVRENLCRIFCEITRKKTLFIPTVAFHLFSFLRESHNDGPIPWKR